MDSANGWKAVELQRGRRADAARGGAAAGGEGFGIIMAGIGSSAVQFARGMWVALAAGLAAISDPISIGKRVGILPADFTLPIGETGMRAIFVAIMLGWMFQWFHRLRDRTERETQHPDTPLHLACRWIVRDSVWAANYPKDRDDEWVSAVRDELMSKVTLGRIELFGRLSEQGRPDSVIQHVAPSFKGRANWHCEWLVTSEPPTHMWSEGSGQVYRSVMLDGRQMRRVWPKRSIWSQLRRKSPIERIGNYSPIFAEQDRQYREKNGYFPTPFAALFA